MFDGAVVAPRIFDTMVESPIAEEGMSPLFGL